MAHFYVQLQFIIKAFRKCVEANAWQCMIQCVVITFALLYFTNLARPERDSDIAGAQFVQKVTSFPHIGLCF